MPGVPPASPRAPGSGQFLRTTPGHRCYRPTDPTPSFQQASLLLLCRLPSDTARRHSTGAGLTAPTLLAPAPDRKAPDGGLSHEAGADPVHGLPTRPRSGSPGGASRGRGPTRSRKLNSCSTLAGRDSTRTYQDLLVCKTRFPRCAHTRNMVKKEAISPLALIFLSTYRCNLESVGTLYPDPCERWGRHEGNRCESTG
ncbi:unnamed protein product [Arctogadus glacialis]